MSRRITNLSGRGRHRLLVTENVLFPATRLTFHFTEPERRALVRRSLMEDGHLIVRPKDESFESDVATLARVLDYIQLAPQRVGVTLGGVARVRIEAVYPHAGHAMAHWTRLAEEIDDEMTCHALAADVLGTLECLALEEVPLAGEIAQMAAESGDPAAVADIVGSVTFDQPADQLSLLAQPDVRTRLGLILERLLGFLASTRR